MSVRSNLSPSHHGPSGTPAQPLRVALCPSAYSPDVGGVEEHVRNLARELAEAGCLVEVWAPEVGDRPRRETIDAVTVRRLPIPLPAARVGPAARFLKEYVPARRAWREEVCRFRPDIVNVHCFGPNGIYGTLAATGSKIPLVLSLHGETFMDDTDVFVHSLVLRAGLRFSIRQAAIITGCSELTLDDARRRFGLAPGEGAVVYNGVDLAEYHGDEPARQAVAAPRRYVLALGRMVHNKGFDLLLDAFSVVASDHPDLDLILGGTGPALAGLRHQATSRGLGDRVIFPGRLSRSEVGRAMRDAAVFVMPSRIEPFGIVVLEAWRAGVPVVATSRGGPAEFATDRIDCLIADPLDHTAFAGAITSVLDDSERAAALVRCGGRRVVDFSWARIAQRYLSLYDRVMRPTQVEADHG